MLHLSRFGGFVVAGLTMVCLLAAAAAPSPLYPVYQQLWGFSAFTLTVIFAVYVVALLVTMLTLGSLADHVGRRPVLIGGLLLQALSMLLFVHAYDVPGLLLARMVQGVATGACTGAATALIVDMQPNAKMGALVSGGSSPFGLALGAALAGILIQHAPWPLALVYWVLLASYVLLVAAMPFVPEQSPKRAGVPIWQALRPRFSVPTAVRPTFLGIIPSLFAAWAPCGLYLSLGSSMIARLLGVHDHMVIGLVLASFFAPAPFATLLSSRLSPAVRSAFGFGALAGGVILTLIAAQVQSLALYTVASIVAGTGFGITFAATMAAISGATPVDDRSQTFAMTFAMAYVAFSLPAVLAGIAARHWNLKSTFFVYGFLEVVVVAAAAFSARATRTPTLRGV